MFDIHPYKGDTPPVGWLTDGSPSANKLYGELEEINENSGRDALKKIITITQQAIKISKRQNLSDNEIATLNNLQALAKEKATSAKSKITGIFSKIAESCHSTSTEANKKIRHLKKLVDELREPILKRAHDEETKSFVERHKQR